VVQSKTKQFSAYDSEDLGTTVSGVKWFVEGQSGAGTAIGETSGILTAVADEPVGTELIVWAISDTGVYGTMTVTVEEFIPASVVDITKRKAVNVSTLTISSTATWINGAAYGESSDGSTKVFVIGSINGKIFRSTNRGDNWSPVSDSKFGSDGVYTIAYGGNGLFVAGGKSGKMAYSEDYGETWTSVTDSKFGSTVINRIRYLNNEFFAVGGSGKMAYSADGKTWIAITSGIGDHSIWDITYGNSKFIAVASGEAANSTAGKLITWSADGKTDWKSVPPSAFSGIFDRTIPSIVYDGGKFVAGCGHANGNLAYSPDAVSSWTITGSIGKGSSAIGGATYGENTNRNLVYGGGLFITVSNSGGADKIIGYSEDGITWSYIVGERNGDGVVFGDGRFIIVDSGKVHIIGD
jgi:photosystem II stability/assembly factor-like uncharacterized protein